MCWAPRQSRWTKSAPLVTMEISAWRVPHEQLVKDAVTMSLRTIIVRPGVVYTGRRGIVSDLLKNALNGLVRVIGPGTNHWPCVYDRDLGELYVRLAESAEASGVYFANDEADETVNDIVEAVANHLVAATRCPARADRGGALEDGAVRRRAGR